MTCAFIDDGYQEKQLIRGEEGLYPSVWITFRPLTTSEVSEWTQEIDGKKSVDIKKITARGINDHIVSWDLDRDPNPKDILKLKPALFDRIFNLLWGYAAGDEQETDLKNSPKG